MRSEIPPRYQDHMPLSSPNHPKKLITLSSLHPLLETNQLLSLQKISSSSAPQNLLNQKGFLQSARCLPLPESPIVPGLFLHFEKAYVHKSHCISLVSPNVYMQRQDDSPQHPNIFGKEMVQGKSVLNLDKQLILKACCEDFF